MDDSTLTRIEAQRTELEANIAKLRRALRHWQTLEIDYEGLKEGFLGVAENSTAEECAAAAKDSRPEVVGETELREILLDKNSRPRRPAQLVELLTKRVDYVVRNIETVRKQLSTADKKRNALLLAQEPDHQDEAGLPLQEIMEELDESGRVISSRVETPGANTAQLMETLKKAGVKDLEETVNNSANAVTAVPEDEGDSGPEDDSPVLSRIPIRTNNSARQSGNTAENQSPTNPNDTPEEAELRREMLEYSRGLDEIGAIVAELEVDEGGSDVSYEVDDVDIDSDLDDDAGAESLDEDSEDETGKSKHSLSVSRGYHKQMAELQEKLGLQNLGPQPDVEETINHVQQGRRPPAAEAARKAAISRGEEFKKSSMKQTMNKKESKDGSGDKQQAKKKVAFTPELDIAPHNEPPVSSTSTASREETPRPKTITESIIERDVVPNEAGPSAPLKPAKQSRFKATRDSQPQTPMFAKPMTLPSGKHEDEKSNPQPPSKTITGDLVERLSTKTPKAPDLDDFSDEAHSREIAVEFQKHRVKRILGQEGGFLGSAEDDEAAPLEDEETGKRVSRFKAARIKP
jgi:unconventional prefoldin RPB5 interactor 1